nr:MAG TPA: hypothetical protein [Caudoviricetes sp.]
MNASLLSHITPPFLVPGPTRHGKYTEKRNFPQDIFICNFLTLKRLLFYSRAN